MCSWSPRVFHGAEVAWTQGFLNSNCPLLSDLSKVLTQWGEACASRVPHILTGGLCPPSCYRPHTVLQVICCSAVALVRLPVVCLWTAVSLPWVVPR